MDQPAHCGSLQRARRYGASVAQRVRAQRCRGVEGDRGVPGPPPVKTEAALRVVAPLLEAPVADRTNWTIQRLITEIEAREGVRIGRSQLSKALRKKTSAGGGPGTR